MSLTTAAASAACRLHQWYARDLDEAWRLGHATVTRTSSRLPPARPGSIGLSPRPGVGTRLDQAAIGRHSAASCGVRG
jgi:L-alanine-DL-glutamate epimerase-like enolase superfamily enzyme